MFKNKILFFLERYDYNNNKISILKDLSFLSINLSIIISRSLKSIIENDSNENISDINHSKDVLNKKKSISILKTFKKNRIQEFNLIDIIEINASTYYHSIKNKENKFFSLTMNEIYDTFI